MDNGRDQKKNNSRGKVVIAEPLENTATELRRGFEHAGYDVDICRNLRCVIEIGEAQHLDLLVIELRLADGPSIKTIEQFRQRHKTVPIVVLTAYGSVAMAVKCARLNVEGYLIKPATVDDILIAATGKNAHTYILPPGPSTFDRIVWEYINRVVEQTGSITEGARTLGIDRRSLRRMLGKYAPRI